MDEFQRARKRATTESIIYLGIDQQRHAQLAFGASSSQARPPSLSDQHYVPHDGPAGRFLIQSLERPKYIPIPICSLVSSMYWGNLINSKLGGGVPTTQGFCCRVFFPGGVL